LLFSAYGGYSNIPQAVQVTPTQQQHYYPPGNYYQPQQAHPQPVQPQPQHHANYHSISTLAGSSPAAVPHAGIPASLSHLPAGMSIQKTSHPSAGLNLIIKWQRASFDL
jgi:hypothetical protein